MRRLLSLLIILAVLGCGLQLGEKETALEVAIHHQFALDAPLHANDGDASTGQPAKHADAGHHHCPIAPDLRSEPVLCAPVVETILTVRPVLVMPSLALAPPIEPPAA
jgi:hypothetical protein